MIIKEELEHVERQGFGEQHTFTIQADAAMFQNLSKNLYSKPYDAIVREYGTNAWDANPQVPFVFHVPTNIEPWFSVRDYGPGLSEAEVFTVYNCYGKSTKKDTNNAIGFFGYGSKSAFAVCSNWSVVSYQNGTQNTYDVYYGEDRIPKVTKVFSKTTDEPNGIMVKIPIAKDKISYMVEVVTSIYSRFIPQPKGNCELHDRDTYKGTPIHEGKDWWLGQKRYSSDRRSTVSQGFIVYPLDESQFGEEPLLTHFSFHVDFPIGELNLAPSRESLHYDNKTKLAISKKIEEIKGEVSKDIKDTLDTLQGNDLGKFTYLRDLYTKSSIFYKVFIESVSSVSTLTLDTTGNLLGIKHGLLFKCNTLEYKSFVYKSLRGQWGAFYIRPLVQREESYGLPSNIVLVWNDNPGKEKHIAARLEQKFPSSTHKDYTFIISEDKGTLDTLRVKFYSGPEIYTLSSDIPKLDKSNIVKQERVSTPYKKGIYFQNVNNVDLSTGGVYVDFNKDSPEKYRDIPSIRDTIRLFSDYANLKIVGVPKSNKVSFDKFNKSNGFIWTELTEYATKELQKIVDEYKGWCTESDIISIVESPSLLCGNEESYMFSPKYGPLWTACTWNNPAFREYIRLLVIRNGMKQEPLNKYHEIKTTISTLGYDKVIPPVLQGSEFLKVVKDTCSTNSTTEMTTIVKGLVEYLNRL